MGERHPPVIVVAGPTASGKTRCAISIANFLGGEIVNCDSVQAYRECSVASAKPSAQERASAPHHGYDIRTIANPLNAAEFSALTTQTIHEIQSRGQRVVLAGGSNLYLKAILEGLADVVPTNPELRTELEEHSNEELYQKLFAIDPERASNLHVNDRVRLIRAVEAASESPKRPSLAYAQHQFRAANFSAVIVVLWLERALLHERIALRVSKMLDAGLLEEARVINALGSVDSRVLDSIGYREALQVVRGELRVEELVPLVVQRTRQYAKQQITFWRNEPGKRGWRVLPQEGDPAVTVGGGAGVKPVRVREFSVPTLLDALQSRLAAPLERTEVWNVSVPDLLI